MNKNNQTAEQKLKTIEQQLVDILTNLNFLKGRQTKISKIIALTYLHRKTTQKQLREFTGYSLGTISTTLQSLEKMGIIRKTQAPQTREYTYELEGTIAKPGSRSVTNIFEYFAQQKQFLKKIKSKLAQPQLSNKKGYKEVVEFVTKMGDIASATESVTQRFFKQLQSTDRSEHDK
ncbi:MAG: hypothetical protein CW716_03205 [Candidatus Bathyarchaeum sp.]|nr:MAG: hypothetical protein CW716_03205 [Candidatus Bathyarchaeum sp.]